MTVRSKYGSESNLLSTYNPSFSGQMIQQHGKAAMMSADTPTLTILKYAFGGKSVSTFLSSYLIDLARFYGVSDKIDGNMIYSIAETIMAEYYHLKISEFVLFFHLMKSGHFRDKFGEDRSRMYGTINGEVIMDCLFKFKQERAKYLEEVESIKKTADRDNSLKNAVPPPSGLIDKINSTISSIGNQKEISRRSLRDYKDVGEDYITRFNPMSESEKIRRANNNAEFYRMLEEQQRKQKLGI